LAESVESLEQLAAQAKAGCSTSFEKIVEQTKDRLFAFLVQLVGNEQDAEDLAQEAFVKAWRKLDTFDGRARFTTWLYTIAKNGAFTHLRKRRAHESIDDLQELLAAEPITNNEEGDSIWIMARQLKPKFYETLWLFYAEGFSLRETAMILDTNAVTVRVNLYRARAALAKKLERAGLTPDKRPKS
jgi:RNA polymerase sigma-70 factor (ECF subfamily)